MSWYHLLSPALEKWVTLAVFVIAFALILYRRFNIAHISLLGAALLVLTGITSPKEVLLRSINWDVLAIYWGYSRLAISFRESGLVSLFANRLLARARKEKYALLFLCVLAMLFSSFMANPVVVIMLAPLAIEIATRLKASLFLYLVALAISSNVVTAVTMISDPPAMLLATATGMNFWDFYWFKGRLGLGTLSIIGILVALMTLFLQFRKLNNPVHVAREEIGVSYVPLAILFLSVLALALIPWRSLGVLSHPGFVGLGVGALALLGNTKHARDMLRESDWSSILFLSGIFVVVRAVENVGLLSDFASLLGRTGIRSTGVYLIIFTWGSVFLSSFIDNVPYTVIMIPVCTSVAQVLGVSPFPFYFGMLVGTGIGGSITPVGATANVLACGILEQRGYKIDLGRYLAISVPFSVSAVLVVHILIQLTWLR